MTHKLKALGLALIAVFAMSALAASAAQAGEFEIVGGGEATVTGNQIAGTITGVENTGKHEFVTKAGKVVCTTAAFHGIGKTATPKELTLTAEYGNTTAGTGCTIGGLAGPIVHMNGCDYLFTAGNTIGATTNITVSAHIKCPAGKVIEVTGGAGACVITIGAQTFAESMITVENSGGAGTAMDVKAFIDVTGIKYEIHGACPNSPAATTPFTDGTYKGVATLQGHVIGSGAAKGITVK